MAPPPTEAELTRSATTIDSLPVEILTEVLLRVPTPAALVHAAAASRSWRGAIASPEFLARYRKRHKASPFLGLYVPRQFAGPPSFQMPDSIRLADDDARDLKDAALRAFDFGEIRRYQDHRLHDAVGDAFILGRLRVHPDCRLLDCHNSRLLLTRGDEALEVRGPLARDSILVPFPPDVVHPDYLEACLLQGHDKAAAAFRVVYLQHHREGRNRQARAVEYDSSRKSWQDHPWETLKSNIEGTPEVVMHAGHRIFCKYTGLTSAALLLDTSNMQFSVLPLPSYQNFAIGEIEDNVCCFVEAVGCADHRLRVWQLDEEKLGWELKKDIKMDQVLGEHVGYYRPRAVSNGVALVCSATTDHHFVVDLNTCSMKEKFEFHGQSAYPMQMPWPPAFSGPTANAMNPGSSEDGNNENQHELRDGVAALNMNQQDLDIQDSTATAPTPAAAEQCFRKDKNYVPNDYLVLSTGQVPAEFAVPKPDANMAEASEGAEKMHKDGLNQESEADGQKQDEESPPTRRVDDSKERRRERDRARWHAMSQEKRNEKNKRRREAYMIKQKQQPNIKNINDGDDISNKEMSIIEDTSPYTVGSLMPGIPNAHSGPHQMQLQCTPDSNGTIANCDSPSSTVTTKNPRKRKLTEEQVIAHRIRNKAMYANMTPEQRQQRRERQRLTNAAPSRKEAMKMSMQHNVYVVYEAQNHVYAAMNPGSSEDGNNENQHELRDGAAALNYMLSNEPQDLDIQDPTATAPTPVAAEQCFGKDKNYVPNDYLSPDLCGQFSDLVHPEAAGGFNRDGGPASVGDARTGSGESDTIEGLFGGTLATAPPAAPAVEPEEPLLCVRIRARSLNHDLLLQPPTLASPQQGGKLDGSRGGKGSPEATTGRGRRQKMPNPKYLGGEWFVRQRRV